MLVAGAAASGCGGGGDAGAGGPHLSRAEYVRQGTAICGRYDAQIHKLGTPKDLQGIAPYIQSALPIVGRAADELGRLRPPPDLADRFAAYVSSLRATRKRALDLRAAAGRADGAKVEALLASAGAASDRSNALARAAALVACVQD